MSLVAVSVPGRRAGDAAAARVAGARDYPAFLPSQNASAAVFAPTRLFQGPPRTGRSPPASFSAKRALEIGRAHV